VKFSIPYGRDRLDVNIPNEKIAATLTPRSTDHVPDAHEAICHALRQPIGTKMIRDQVSRSDRVTIMISDVTRPVPDGLILPHLINELSEAGVADERIRILVATGLHRPCTREELQQRIGKVVDRIPVTSHDARDTGNLACIGRTSVGNDVWINSSVATSDFKIATGCIEPHTLAGYSGGRKTILPGVAGEETIRHNHSPEMIVHPKVGFGRIDENPIHTEMQEASKLANLDFIVNVVWTPTGKLMKTVAGNPEQAWREGVRAADEVYRRTLDKKADIVVAGVGGYPHDINLYQAISHGLDSTLPLVRDGGSIVLVAECSEGVGSDVMYRWLKEASTPEDVLHRMKREGLAMNGHVAWYLCLNVLTRVKIIVVSKLPPRLLDDMFMKPASSVADALALAAHNLGRSWETIVIPDASKIVSEIRGNG